ncbi:MAG: MucB/RseB C-terminal domain-containing protein [Methylococcales bacterium]
MKTGCALCCAYKSNSDPGQLDCFFPYKSLTAGVILLTILWLAMLGRAQAEPVDGARVWLDAMVRALRETSFRGDVIFFRDNKIDTMSVVHKVSDGVVHERMVTLNGPVREIVRDADKVTCYFPDTQTVVLKNNTAPSVIFSSLPNNLDNTGERYSFNLKLVDRVAQRETQIVSIEPKDNLRYSRRIWIDVATKLPLRYQLLDEELRAIEQMVFLSVEMLPSSHEMKTSAEPVLLKTRSSGIRDRAPLPTKEAKNWRLGVIPVGFKQIFHRQNQPLGNTEPIEHILLSDSFSSVSIYIDKNDQSGGFPSERRIGAISSYSRATHGFFITVMGEVPLKTVRMIADGLNYIGPN